MRRRIPMTVLAAMLAGLLLLLGSGSATAAPPTVTNPLKNIPITGTTADGGNFTGTLTITQFTAQNGQLAAVGTLTGTLVDAAGNTVGQVSQTVTVPAQISGSCQILHLELGPLDLDLLGLQVHLDRVVLDITAQQGPGNLLGNLLCAIANLLNGNASQNALNTLVGLINQLLRLLG